MVEVENVLTRLLNAYPVIDDYLLSTVFFLLRFFLDEILQVGRIFFLKKETGFSIY